MCCLKLEVSGNNRFCCKVPVCVFVAKCTALLQLQNTILTTESRIESTDTAKICRIQAK